ncbi:MAG: DUF3365 domain-containing protein [Planctomycetota bacterium]
MIRKTFLVVALTATAAGVGFSLTGCGSPAAAGPTGISPEKFADGVHAVMMADRTVYAKHVVTRLKAQTAPVKPDEYWDKWSEDSGDPHMLPLPAQMFRMGASLVNENPEAGFQYSLKSLWPLNPEHKPVDEAEIKALEFLSDNPGENYTSEVTDPDGNKLFVKYYPDRAVAEACWSCHNEHERRGDEYPEFEKDDVMGAVAVYVPMD